MNVLVVSNVDYVGGAETVLADLAVRDQRNSYLVLAPIGKFTELLCRLRIDFIGSRYIRTLNRHSGIINAFINLFSGIFGGGYEIVRIARARRIDILYANSLRSGIYCMIPSIVARIPLLWHVHDASESRVWSVLMSCLTRCKSNIKVVGVSECVLNSRVLSHVSPSRKALVYNGLDVSVYSPSSGIRGGEKISILLYGRIIRWKGYDIAINALSMISVNVRSRLTCSVVGDCSDPVYYAELVELVRDLGLHEIVRFGPSVAREDVPELLDSADVVIHSAVNPDPLPTVVLEAMAKGKVVIASRVGGVPEIIEDGVSGYTVPPDNPQELAKLIERVVSQINSSYSVGKAARERILDVFSIDKKVERFNELYSVLAKDSRKEKW
ncbi:Glycosyltransferase involved in cell wall bisynthesis [Alicyclobacillus hesperidum]|uniref:Glycosyltransferase involved in cell wall bisynthesis n=1 Tax=Alicyclobacillus hesperidum TaxID=89784 RepID=A0A1H2WJM7_9BACL|nr:Glycosyltransferase involved in cell wall bisynthesis [Alicyclobacillus hesperidum]